MTSIYDIDNEIEGILTQVDPATGIIDEKSLEKL